jgi:hypothetical protein
MLCFISLASLVSQVLYHSTSVQPRDSRSRMHVSTSAHYTFEDPVGFEFNLEVEGNKTFE